MTSTAPAGRAGFTLVELLVALVIVGMIGAVVAPALRSRGGAAAAAKQLASVYEATRGVAIARGTPAEAVLDLSSGAYVIALGFGQSADTVRRGELALSPHARLSSRTGRGARARMAFDPLGRARGDVVTVADENGRHAVVADAWTGATRVEAR